MIAYPTRLVAAAVVLAAVAIPAPLQGQTDDALEEAVEHALREDRKLRDLEVTVDGSEVTLAGRVETFWEKSEALRRTFEVPGVGTVASEIEIPAVEDEQELTDEVIKAIQRYEYTTMWDQIDFRMLEGAVTLSGRVTPLRDKAGELFERIAKVKGVQDLQVHLETLPSRGSDETIRNSIRRQLLRNEHFMRTARSRNPPYRIIVDNGIVTLLGYAQSDIERIEMQRIVGQTNGVLRVDNQLQTLR